MTPDALLEANLRLAETPEFELSDTDRLGLFVVSRLAQRQNVRVSLQPSPYGGTTAVVFIPDALLTDDVPDTNGIGFRLDRTRPTKRPSSRRPAGRRCRRPRRSSPECRASLFDGRSSWRRPSVWTPSANSRSPWPRTTTTSGVLFRPRRSAHRSRRGGASTPRTSTAGRPPGRANPKGPSATTRPRPCRCRRRRRTPKLVSSHGRPVPEQRLRARRRTRTSRPGPARAASTTASRRRCRRRRAWHGGPDPDSGGAADSVSRRRSPTPEAGRPPRPPRFRRRARQAAGPVRRPGARRSARRSGRDTGSGRERCRGASGRPTWPRSCVRARRRARTDRSRPGGPGRRRGTQPDGLAPARLAARPPGERRGRPTAQQRHSTTTERHRRGTVDDRTEAQHRHTSINGELNWLLDELVGPGRQHPQGPGPLRRRPGHRRVEGPDPRGRRAPRRRRLRLPQPRQGRRPALRRRAGPPDRRRTRRRLPLRHRRGRRQLPRRARRRRLRRRPGRVRDDAAGQAGRRHIWAPPRAPVCPPGG